MKYPTKFIANGELQTYRQLTPDNIKKVREYIERLAIEELLIEPIKISQAQAVNFLRERLKDEKAFYKYFLVAKGYNDDWENYTEVLPEEIENVEEDMYEDYQLWLSDSERTK